MTKSLHRFTFIVALFFVCTGSLKAQEKKRAPDGPGEKIYKHYTGTIGDKKIVLDLVYGYQGGSNYGGSRYYYPGKPGTIHFYIGEPPTFDHAEMLNAEISPEDASLTTEYPDRSLPHIQWDFKIIKNEIRGKWISADNKEKLDIKLKEDYSSSYPLDLLWEKTPVVKGAGAPAEKENRYLSVKPAATMNAGDADFINAQLALFIASTRNLYIITPVFNEDGLLVIRNWFYADGTQQNTFLCLDVRNKKVITLSDVLNLDEKKMAALLETEVRNKYKMTAPNKLSAWLLVSEMMVTENIMLAHGGINFCYSPGTLVKEKELIVFLSYDQLKSMMKPDFIKRLGL